jgi:acetyl-CoA carboxylase biotin carboxyl carrier protein
MESPATARRAAGTIYRLGDPVAFPSIAVLGASPEEAPMATQVEAQITGNVWKIEKAVGDAVAEGEAILILESMKMEIPVESPCAGRVSEIRVREGDSVEEGAVLAVVEG